MVDAEDPTDPLLGEVAPSPRIDRDLMLARVEQRLLGRALEPVRVGRFAVLQRVGQGGMGIVYAAHDLELDRKVAVKIVDDGGDAPEAQQELLREARAAAALAHPNVVTIYEVGVEGQTVYLAMEYVDGPTLRRWLEATSRSWREVVGMFVAAGRGLAAAHRAGLVHRDFKPDNVLIGGDGRPRVADFGLARTAPQERTQPGGGASSGGEGTFTAVAGTPRYMAPEQHEGRGIGPASDQFAFCVALYEALYGGHPFGGTSATQLVARVLAGKLEPPGPSARAVPAQVTRLVTKGLSTRASQRHASMDVLLDGLSRALQRRRRIVLGTAALSLASLASVIGYQVAPQPVLDPCADAARPVQARWNPEVRQAVEDAFAATGQPGAEATATLVTDKIDRYAAEWSAMRERTCRDTLEQGQRSELLMELSYACLERRLTGMTTLIDRFVTTDAATITRAAQAVDELVPLSRCEDRGWLLSLRGSALRSESDRTVRPEAYQEFHALLDRVARGEALRSLGERDQALAIAEDVIERAREGGLRGAEGAALVLRGTLRQQASALEDAQADLARAAALGLEVDMVDVAIPALLRLSGVMRLHREGAEHAPVLLDLARGLSRREPVSASYALQVAIEQAKLDRLQRRLPQARDGLQQALAAAEELGPTHTAVLSARNDLAANLSMLGQHAEAERIYAELLPLRVAVFGPRHRSVGTLLINLGAVSQTQQRWDAARDYYERALDFYDRSGDARNAEKVRFRLGVMLRDQDRWAEAAALLAVVLEERRARLGPEHADLAEVLEALADAERLQGRYDSAVAHVEQAVALLERAHGPDYLDLRAPLVTLGKIELGRGRPAAAEAVLRRAHALVYATEVDGVVRGEVCFALARATVDDPAKRAAALELAREAARLFGAEGAHVPKEKAEVDAWLREHAG